MLIGLASLLKPHYAFFLLWAAVRREWGFTIACSLTGLLGLGVALAIFGVSNNLDYLNALSLLSERGESFYANQSVNGILNQIMGLWAPALYYNFNCREDSFPPYTPLVYYGTFITSATLLFMVLAMRRSDTLIDFCIAGLGLTMASPIAWEHHYGILLPIYVVAFVRLFDSRSALLLLAFSYALTSNLWSGTNFLATTAFNFMQAYLFMGALILLLLLVFTELVSPPRRNPSTSNLTSWTFGLPFSAKKLSMLRALAFADCRQIGQGATKQMILAALRFSGCPKCPMLLSCPVAITADVEAERLGPSSLHSDAFTWAGKSGSIGFERSFVFAGVIAINVFLIESVRLAHSVASSSEVIVASSPSADPTASRVLGT